MAKESNISSILPISPENIKIAEYFVIGVVLFLFFRGQIRKSRQAKQYEQAGTDVNTSHAIQVRQACNPSGIALMVEFDGTWDNDLMLVADQIGNPDEVAKAYLNLYNENMYERLEKELTSVKFQQWIQRAKAAPKAEQTSTTATIAKMVAVTDTTIWSDTDSSKWAKKVKAGDAIGTRLKAYYITNSASLPLRVYINATDESDPETGTPWAVDLAAYTKNYEAVKAEYLKYYGRDLSEDLIAWFYPAELSQYVAALWEAHQQAMS